MATTNTSDMMNPRNIAIAVVTVVVLLALFGWAGGWFGGQASMETSAPATTTEQPATTGQGTTTTEPSTTEQQGTTTTQPSTTTQQ